jgi:hypothetical protein
MVHEYGEGALLLLQDVLAGGAATHHLTRPTVLRHGQVGVHQAVVTRLTCTVRLLVKYGRYRQWQRTLTKRLYYDDIFTAINVVDI